MVPVRDELDRVLLDVLTVGVPKSAMPTYEPGSDARVDACLIPPVLREWPGAPASVVLIAASALDVTIERGRGSAGDWSRRFACHWFPCGCVGSR